MQGRFNNGVKKLLLSSIITLLLFSGCESEDSSQELSTLSPEVKESLAYMGNEEPPGSGVFMPDDAMSNLSKLNTNESFWEVLALAGDIAGGVAVTMPSEMDLENPEIGKYVSKYLKSAVPAKKRMRMLRFLQNWVAGLHGVGTYQGAGPSQNEMLVLYRITNLEEKKKMAEELANTYY